MLLAVPPPRSYRFGPPLVLSRIHQVLRPSPLSENGAIWKNQLDALNARVPFRLMAWLFRGSDGRYPHTEK